MSHVNPLFCTIMALHRPRFITSSRLGPLHAFSFPLKVLIVSMVLGFLRTLKESDFRWSNSVVYCRICCLGSSFLWLRSVFCSSLSCSLGSVRTPVVQGEALVQSLLSQERNGPVVSPQAVIRGGLPNV
uniref:Uncharacterized protein n=1 Tax=Sphaerodactylus townsendi TaxID=933632 RepID=A0ACB8FWP0_9SAUR